MTVGVIDLFLLRVAEHAIGFGAFAKFRCCLGLVFRIAVGMPLQRGLAVGGLNFLHRRSVRDPQHFVKIAWIPFGHETLHSPLVHGFLRCAARACSKPSITGMRHSITRAVARLESSKRSFSMRLR